MSNSTSEMKSAEPSKRRAGPKRSEASKAAVLEAAYAELSEHGWRGFSVDRVAKEARASKQTIYRWWRTPARLAVDAALEKMPKSAQAEGDARIRIEAIVAPLVRATRTGDGAHAWRSALLAAADDAEAGEAFRAWFNDTVKRPLRHVLAEQANKGRIRRDWDVDLAVEMLAGPIWHRLIAMRSLVPERYAERLADGLMDMLETGAPRG